MAHTHVVRKAYLILKLPPAFTTANLVFISRVTVNASSSYPRIWRVLILDRESHFQNDLRGLLFVYATTLVSSL